MPGALLTFFVVHTENNFSFGNAFAIQLQNINFEEKKIRESPEAAKLRLFLASFSKKQICTNPSAVLLGWRHKKGVKRAP